MVLLVLFFYSTPAGEKDSTAHRHESTFSSSTSCRRRNGSPCGARSVGRQGGSKRPGTSIWSSCLGIHGGYSGVSGDGGWGMRELQSVEGIGEEKICEYLCPGRKASVCAMKNSKKTRCERAPIRFQTVCPQNDMQSGLSPRQY
jgi:hypothetical protein